MRSRYIHDFDLTIASDRSSLLRIESRLCDEGFAKTDEHGGRLPKDARDLLDLCRLPNLDWGYIAHWAEVFEVNERLAYYRSRVE